MIIMFKEDGLRWGPAETGAKPRIGPSHVLAVQPLPFEETRSQTGTDLLILPVEGDEASGWKPGTPTVFLSGPFAEQQPRFAPDGR